MITPIVKFATITSNICSPPKFDWIMEIEENNCLNVETPSIYNNSKDSETDASLNQFINSYFYWNNGSQKINCNNENQTNDVYSSSMKICNDIPFVCDNQMIDEFFHKYVFKEEKNDSILNINNFEELEEEIIPDIININDDLMLNDIVDFNIYIMDEVFSKVSIDECNLSLEDKPVYFCPFVEEEILQNEFYASPLFKGDNAKALDIRSNIIPDQNLTPHKLPDLVYPTKTLTSTPSIIYDQSEKSFKGGNGSIQIQNPNPKKDSLTSHKFPRTTSIVHDESESHDQIPTFIVTSDLKRIFDKYSSFFQKTKILYRQLRACDIEINEKMGVIITEKDMTKLIESMISFEEVIVLKQFNDKNSSFIHGINNLKVRYFPNQESMMMFLAYLTKHSYSFLREKETLHEYLLSLFPTISKTLAQLMLQKGNPITDPTIDLSNFPQMNIFPFTFILDTPSQVYQSNMMNMNKKSSYKASYNKVRKSKKEWKKDEIPSNPAIPGKVKVRAPKPEVIEISKYFLKPGR